MKTIRAITGSVGILCCVSLIGCGQGLKSSGSSQGSQSIDTSSVNTQINQAAQAANDASSALQNVTTAINQISDAQGNINIGMFLMGSDNPLNALIAQLQTYFDQFYTKAQAVESSLDSARTQIQQAIAQLNPNDPAQATEIQQLNAELAQVNSLDQQFSNAMHSLATKLGTAMTGLDNLINGVTASIPGWGAIVGLAVDWLVMDNVRTLFQDMENKLNSL